MKKVAPVNVFSLRMPSNANSLGRFIRLQTHHEEEGHQGEAGEHRKEQRDVSGEEVANDDTGWDVSYP
jgi:hypothetical protein